jgi:diaminopropionate ammonia-lyase
VAWPLLQSGLDVVLTVDDDAARNAMRDLCAVGIEAGETGAAALAGAEEIVHRDRPTVRHRAGLDDEATILLIVTEGPTDPAAYESIVGQAPNRVVLPPARHPVGFETGDVRPQRPRPRRPNDDAITAVRPPDVP